MEDPVKCWRCGTANSVKRGHTHDGKKKQYFCKLCRRLFVVPQDLRRYPGGTPKCRHCNVVLASDNWYRSDRDRNNWGCISCRQKSAREWRIRTDYNRNLAMRLRGEVMSHYGGKCACCGEGQIQFLTLDHVNNDGSAHRRRMSGGKRRDFGGWRLYRWLRVHGYPKEVELQILCWNCNEAKRFYQVCPHQTPTDLVIQTSPEPSNV